MRRRITAHFIFKNTEDTDVYVFFGVDLPQGYSRGMMLRFPPPENCFYHELQQSPDKQISKPQKATYWQEIR